MLQATFTSANQDVLVIDNNIITVTNKFGETYVGILQSGKIRTAKRLGLVYLVRAFNAYQAKVAADATYFCNRMATENHLEAMFS